MKSLQFQMYSNLIKKKKFVCKFFPLQDSKHMQECQVRKLTIIYFKLRVYFENIYDGNLFFLRFCNLDYVIIKKNELVWIL